MDREWTVDWTCVSWHEPKKGRGRLGGQMFVVFLFLNFNSSTEDGAETTPAISPAHVDSLVSFESLPLDRPDHSRSSRQSFNGVLENYPSEQQRFRLVKAKKHRIHVFVSFFL